MSEFRVKRVTIPFASIMRLTEEERYALFLLGHIFNEIMALNKFAMMSNFKSQRKRSMAEKAGGVFNAMFFSRMLAGKLYEASEAIRRKEVSKFLREHCFPLLKSDGAAALREFNRAVSQSKWLNEARNGHAMHYPTLVQSTAALTALKNGKAGFDFFVGEKHGEALYWTSDAMAATAFAFEANSGDYRSGLNEIVDHLYGVSDLLLGLVGDSINSFALNLHESKAMYAERVKVKDVARFDMHDVTDYEMPYFVVVR